VRTQGGHRSAAAAHASAGALVGSAATAGCDGWDDGHELSFTTLMRSPAVGVSRRADELHGAVAAPRDASGPRPRRAAAQAAAAATSALFAAMTASGGDESSSVAGGDSDLDDGSSTAWHLLQQQQRLG